MKGMPRRLITNIAGGFAAALVLCSCSRAVAGDTGRLSGKAVDASTGEPLVGVDILVVGTTRGAATDLEGRYSVIGIPEGTYTVKASLLSYNVIEVTRVRIIADETVSLNFRMVPSSIQMGEISVTGQSQIVNVQTTAAEQTIGSHTIEQIPAVKSVRDVMALQPGVVQLGRNLFLRGGRANEIQYLVDGVPVNDILGGSSGLLAASSVNAQLQQLYAGVQSGYIGGGATGLSVSANAIQTVTVSSSGFDAEYGNAQSGVINIITKSGSDRYVGALQYRTDRFASKNFNEAYFSGNIGGPEPVSHYALPAMGVRIPGNITFFANIDLDHNDGPWTFAQNGFYHPLLRKIEFAGFLGRILNGLGLTYRDYLNNSYTFDSKLKYDIGSDQIMYGYRASLGSNHNYNHPWYYRADSSVVGTSVSSQSLLQWTHFLGTNSFFRFYLARLANQNKSGVADLTPPEYSPATQGTDPNHDWFNELGSDQDWYDGHDAVYTVKFDFNSQVTQIHYLKAGLEYDYEALQSTEIQYPLAAGRTIDFNARGEFPGYGLYRWVLNNYTDRGSAYFQDNIEYEGLNLHAGIRYDFFYPGKQVFAPDYVAQWQRATGLTAQWPNHKSGNSALLWYLTHGWWSPRLAVGYPITDRIVFYFNYGHFYQFPDRDQYFRDPFTFQAGGWVGNPDLKPQKTIQYETGFDDQFRDDMAFSIRGFYKDIFDYTTLAPSYTVEQLYVNLDYASARGFEVTLNKILTNHLSGSISYTYQIAKGRSASPYAALYQPQFELPRETRLDYDQNHTLNLFASYRVSPKEDFSVFGVPLDNWGASLTWSFGSGFPYTPYSGGRSYASQYLKNSANGPYSSDINLSVYKGFLVLNHLNMLVTLDVTNLLDRRNPSSTYLNTLTGTPYVYGDYDPSTNLMYQWYQMAGEFFPPYRFGSPRQILLGVRMNWE